MMFDNHMVMSWGWRRRGPLCLSLLTAILLVGISFTDLHAAWEYDPSLCWTIGPWGGGYKFVGGNGDRAELGLHGGLQLKHLITERYSIVARGGYGRNGEWQEEDYKTIVYSGEVLAQYNLLVDRAPRPYVGLGLGLNAWKSELDGQKVLTASGNQVEGNDVALKLGLGVELDIADRWLLDLRGAASTLLREDSHLQLGGIDDPNDGELEVMVGVLYRFSGQLCGGPRDTDRDGVADEFDRCPGTPYGAMVDAQGCRPDRDSDGVPDELDRCPDTPRGAVVDERGCPQDSDGDGVYDGIDRCPDTAARVVVDTRGCPVDSDRDGVPDGIDRCPNTPRGTTVDTKGCPPPAPEPPKRIVLEGVNFQSGTANLLPAARAVLDAAARDLQDRRDVRVRILGHTDDVGDDGTNLRLSEARAQAVRDYLISKGVAPNRLTAVGLGEAEPIAPNDTPGGRARNRRVEFEIVE